MKITKILTSTVLATALFTGCQPAENSGRVEKTFMRVIFNSVQEHKEQPDPHTKEDRYKYIVKDVRPIAKKVIRVGFIDTDSNEYKTIDLKLN